MEPHVAQLVLGLAVASLRSQPMSGVDVPPADDDDALGEETVQREAFDSTGGNINSAAHRSSHGQRERTTQFALSLPLSSAGAPGRSSLDLHFAWHELLCLGETGSPTSSPNRDLNSGQRATLPALLCRAPGSSQDPAAAAGDTDVPRGLSPSPRRFNVLDGVRVERIAMRTYQAPLFRGPARSGYYVIAYGRDVGIFDDWYVLIVIVDSDIPC